MNETILWIVTTINIIYVIYSFKQYLNFKKNKFQFLLYCLTLLLLPIVFALFFLFAFYLLPKFLLFHLIPQFILVVIISISNYFHKKQVLTKKKSYKNHLIFIWILFIVNFEIHDFWLELRQQVEFVSSFDRDQTFDDLEYNIFQIDSTINSANQNITAELNELSTYLNGIRMKVELKRMEVSDLNNTSTEIRDTIEHYKHIESLKKEQVEIIKKEIQGNKWQGHILSFIIGFLSSLMVWYATSFNIKPKEIEEKTSNTP